MDGIRAGGEVTVRALSTEVQELTRGKRETERRGSGMAAEVAELILNTWMRSDKASCCVFADSVSPFPLFHPDLSLPVQSAFGVRGPSLPGKGSQWGGLGVI